MGVIEIDKNLIPYKFDIELSNRIYTIGINYNYIFDFFTVDFALGSKILVEGEKILLNEILFKDIFKDQDGNFNEDFPNELLFFTASDNSIDRITYDNFGKEVQLYYIDREEV